MNAIEGIIFATEAVVYVRSADESPVESISPTVIAALDPSGKTPFGAGTDAGTSMPADVEKRPQRVALVSRNDDAFTGHLAQKIVARRGDLVGAPGADPVLAIEAFEFVTKEIGVRVVAGG
jgi:hypothetical protein